MEPSQKTTTAEKIIRAILLLFLLGIVGIFFYPSFRIIKRDLELKPQQEKLAKSLGVNIQDYPYSHDFPSGYFFSALKPGMTIREVHAIVKGYKEVYRCFGYTELYYYFSGDVRKAVVFLLTYNKSGKFIDLTGNDPFSNSFGVGSECSIGLLEE